jgi:hypothetical protein
MIRWTLAVCMAVLLAAPTAIQAQSSDTRLKPYVGTWQLDNSDARFNPGPPPRSETLSFGTDGSGSVQVTLDRTNLDGDPQTIRYAGNVDGKPVPYVGDPAYDSITMTMAKDGAIEGHLWNGGKMLTNNRTFVTPDGKTLNMVIVGVDPNGIHEAHVFTKQSDRATPR